MVRALRQRAARMQRLLEYREQLVEEAQRRLAEEQRFVVACEAALAQLEASQRALAVSLATLAGKSVDATLLSGAEAYQAWLSQRRDEREAALAEAKRRAEAARAALVAQRREAKKLEHVRARWLGEVRRAELAAEAKLLDEIANGQAARRTLGAERLG